MNNFAAKIERFRALLENETRERMMWEYPKMDPEKDAWFFYVARVVPGKKYTKVDIGPRANMSGKYIVENDTGRIYGIKGYGVIHRGHYYGTLDEIDRWNWGGYVGMKKRGVA